MTSRSLPVRRGPMAPAPKGIVSGEREAIFAHLPEEVRLNMQRADSESALVWETFYPFASRGLAFARWASIRPLWGQPFAGGPEDRMVPYFWGMSVDGSPLEGLGQAAEEIAGREDRLEVDLYLRGERVLVAVEAKVEGEPGRCGRFEAGRCPEIHGGAEPCRYWEAGASFDARLELGARPDPSTEGRPPCARTYQLARTLLIVERLGRASGLEPHLCLLVPRRRWPAVRPGWQDFADRVRDEGMWRRMRVVAWEDLQGLTADG